MSSIVESRLGDAGSELLREIAELKERLADAEGALVVALEGLSAMAEAVRLLQQGQAPSSAAGRLEKAIRAGRVAGGRRDLLG